MLMAGSAVQGLHLTLGEVVAGRTGEGLGGVCGEGAAEGLEVRALHLCQVKLWGYARFSGRNAATLVPVTAKDARKVSRGFLLAAGRPLWQAAQFFGSDELFTTSGISGHWNIVVQAERLAFGSSSQKHGKLAGVVISKPKVGHFD